ncbi:hypothetical protein [Hymenobacter bucti]|uniref:DUF1795 domain-containing protein n=1 Tax=Hymenobacter bucti TaxID=1844114 RepID=A0ABW4QXD7_9BACT
MKNSFTLFGLLVFCFALLAFRPFAWVPVSLDNRVSVQLPVQPQETALPAPARMLTAKDAVGTYTIFTSPLGADFQGARRKEYYDSIVESFLSSGNGKLVGRSTFQLGGYDGVDFTAKVMGPDNQQSILLFARCLIVDKRAYVLQLIPTDSGKSDEAQRKPFFESLTLKPVTE